MNDLVNISIGNAAQVALLGYLVVFMGLVMLMVVIMIMGKIMTAKARKAQTVAAAVTPAQEPAPKAVAPGTAGELKLYDTDPRDAAMIMAIVADTLGKPLNELRFISIKEVKEDEV
jgi:Na+-transporting methylmalonyl-CoA/oxaloacetate decarboxylase gamma subunit